MAICLFTNHACSFANTDEARKVLAREDLFLGSYQVFLKVPRKDCVPKGMTYDEFWGPKDGWHAETGPSRRGQMPMHSQSMSANTANKVPSQNFHAQYPANNGNFRAHHSNLSGGSSRDLHSGNPAGSARSVQSSDTTPVMSEASAPRSKKGGKSKKYKKAKSEFAPSHTNGRGNAGDRRPVTSASTSSPVDHSVNPQENISTSHKHETRQLTGAAPTATGGSAITPASRTTIAKENESLVQHEPLRSPGVKQPQDLPTCVESSEVTQTVSSPGSAEKVNASVAENLEHGDDVEVSSISSLSPGETPLMLAADTVEQESTPPKATEDVDDSFQTAAETPESVRDISNGSVVSKISRAASMSQVRLDLRKSSLGSMEGQSTAKLDVPEKSDETAESSKPDDSTADSDVATEKTQSQSGFIKSGPESRRLEAIKSGPSKTESLSPFARPVQSKKKEKQKAQKKARKNGKSDSSDNATERPTSSTGDKECPSSADEELITSSAPTVVDTGSTLR